MKLVEYEKIILSRSIDTVALCLSYYNLNPHEVKSKAWSISKEIQEAGRIYQESEWMRRKKMKDFEKKEEDRVIQDSNMLILYLSMLIQGDLSKI